jgi:hypothetical protein
MMENFEELMAEHNRQQAREAMINAREALERGLQELNHYIDRFDQADSDKTRAQVVNWAINHLVCGIQPNLRIDLMADRQSQLTNQA